MFSKHVKLLCFLVTLPSFLGSADIIRPKVDVNLRGQSFGLENFLFQSLGEEVKPKRARPTGNQRLTDRGHTHNLENLPAYDSSKIRPTEQKTNEPKPELNKFKDKINPTAGEMGAVQDTVTERIRKRIMMRRRRKKPQDGSNDITGNAIQKLVISNTPVLPEASKVVIRPKLPDQETIFRLKPQEVKLTVQTENFEPKEKEPDAEKVTTTMKTPTINLKTFLKQQTETLSLSELLQTQNLSLADLIRGNKDASSILRAKQVITSTTPSVKRKYNRLEVEPDNEKFSKKIEIVEVTTARPNYKRFQPKIPKIKPSDPKSTEEILEGGQIKRKSFVSSASDPQNRLNDMRLKLRNYQRKTNPPVAYTEAVTVAAITDETIEPLLKITEAPKKTKVYFKSTNNPELSVILPNKPKPDTKPQKRPIWNNRLPPPKRLDQDRIKQSEISLKVQKADEENFEEATTGIFEEPKPESKDELIELLKSGQNAERLQKILKSRNMTLQELLDNREKPPSHMNITDLFSSQEKMSTTVKPTLFDSFPDFEGESRPEYDEPEAEESAPRIARVKIVPNTEAEPYPVSEKEKTQLNLQPDDLTADTSNAETSALWELSEKSIYYGSSYGYGDFAVQTEKSKRTTEETENDLETIQKNQETNGKFKLDFNDFVREEDEPQAEDIEKSYIPPAVKSAIIASGVVMGIAFFVFVGIFAACGWKQRQIRLKSSLGDASKKDKRTLSPLSFSNNSYKKSIDFDESSESGTSNTSSYLWSTLKNTFTSRTSTLKSRLEKEEKMREDKVTLRRNESRRKESRPDDRQITDERLLAKKLDGDRSVINTSFNFKKSMSINSVNHFNECVHGY